MGVGTEHVAVQLIPDRVRFVCASALGGELSPEYQPALLAPAPGSDDNGQAVMLNVDANGQHQAAGWDGHFRVGLGALLEYVDGRCVGSILIRQSETGILEHDHVAFVALLQRVLCLQVPLDQHGQLGTGKRRVELVYIEPGHATERALCQPIAFANIPVFVYVPPGHATMRAHVAGGIGLGLAEHFVGCLCALVPNHVLPVQHMHIAALVARHHEAAPVAGQVRFLNPRQALDRGRAAEYDFAVFVGFRPLFEQLDRVTLPLNVGVAVVWLLHADNRC
jgi:hypothetical protein